MPINPVLARIDVMVSGQSTLDRLANTYVALEQRSQQAQRAITAWDRAHGNAIRNTTGFLGSINNLTDRMNRNIDSMKQSGNAASRFSGSIVNLTKSMILFGTLLPLIHFPQTAIRSWEEGVQAAGAWEDKMISIRQIASDMNGQQFAQMDTNLQRISVQWGLTTQDMDQARKVMSTTNVVADDLGSTMDQTTKGLTLFNDVAKLATAGSTDVNNAWQTLATVADTLHLATSQVPQAMDLVFETVKSGRNSIEDFNTAGARFLPVWQSVINSAPNGQQMSRLNEVFAIYSQMSLALGPQAAGTGMTQVMRNIQHPNQALKEVITAARSQGMDIRPQNLITQGPAAYLQGIARAISPDSPLVQHAIQQAIKSGATKPQDARAAAETLADYYANQIFGVRSIRGIESLTDTQQFQNIMAQRTADLMAGSPVDRAAQMRQTQSLPMAEQRREAAMQRFQVGVSQNVLPLLVDANNKVADLISDLVDTDKFQRADVLGKVQQAASVLIQAFTQWYTNGGGQAQLRDAAYSITRGIGEFMSAFLGAGEGQGIYAQVGRDMAAAIGAGIKDSLPDILRGLFTGQVGQTIVGTALLRSSGFGLLPSLAGGVAGAGLMQGGAGIPGQLLAGGAGALLGYAFLRRTGASLGRSRIPLIGQTAGAIGSAVADEAFHRNALQALNTLGIGSIRDPATGRFINTGLSEYNRIQRSGQTAGARNLRTALKVGGTGLAIGAPLLATLLGGGNTRDLFSTGGSILGALGGAFIPGLGQIGVGELLGGAAGGVAGGALYDYMFGNRGTGTGGGDLPQDQQDFIQMMVRALNASDINLNTYQLVAMQSRGIGAATGGITAAGGTTTAGAAGGTPGTGGGNLSANFIDQFSSQQLTKAQADAACGPAAAAFFARAYGRNPTLSEAYALQNQLQGGDISNLGGSNINALQQNINKTVGSNVASLIPGSDFGANGGPGWGRISDAAKQGVPSIINIGPSGSRNAAGSAFPGHYLQVAGWDPTTNKFNVGISGSTIGGWGGKTQMTPQEMMAIGPILGGITGTSSGLVGGTSGTGGGDLHAAAIAAAKAAGIDPNIFTRQIQQESGFNPTAISHAGAMGIGQFMKGTFGAGVDWDPMDPNVALTKSAQYDAQLIGKYGSWKNALWAYNAGEGNYTSGIMPAETKAYLNDILGGSGTGPGDGTDMVSGSGMTFNGPLIGQAIINNDEDIRVTAAKLVAALKVVARGGTTSQHDQVKP